jgi:hypothetical protein
MLHQLYERHSGKQQSGKQQSGNSVYFFNIWLAYIDMVHNSFASRVLDFHFNLPEDPGLIRGVEIIYPYHDADCVSAMRRFYSQYYNDSDSRVFLFGINPGRFGSGVTGIGFTDACKLENICGIKNNFRKRSESSSDFIYEVINAYGGPEKFYKEFYFTSVLPLGLLKGGKNYNYYDDPRLFHKLELFLADCIKKQLAFGSRNADIICIGQSKNLQCLQHLNKRFQLFGNLHTVPHPRWIMQYRRKDKEMYVGKYLDILSSVSRQ